jgi:hypothetical protein
MPYRTVKALSPVDAAYMAGLIDGEGTVTLSRRRRNDQRQLAVSIANTERRLLEWTLDTVGAGKITGKRISSPRAHNSSSSITSTSPPRNGRYTEKIRAERDRFLTTVLGIKASVPPDLARL